MKNEGLTEAEIDARHAEKAVKRKAARAKIMATKTIEKGLLIVHTGKGKGKSTAALGLVMRALGHGFKVGVVQFVNNVCGMGISASERAVTSPHSRPEPATSWVPQVP